MEGRHFYKSCGRGSKAPKSDWDGEKFRFSLTLRKKTQKKKEKRRCSLGGIVVAAKKAPENRTRFLSHFHANVLQKKCLVKFSARNSEHFYLPNVPCPFVVFVLRFASYQSFQVVGSRSEKIHICGLLPI